MPVKSLIKITILLLFFFSCTSRESLSKDSTDNSVILEKNRNKVISNESITERKYYKHEMIGVWGTDSLENASFVLTDDSMYYVEYPNDLFFYSIRNDTLLFHLEDDVIQMKILKLTGDSLELRNSKFIETYVRLRHR